MLNIDNTKFNYFITIHNKEFLIEDVVLNVLRCMNRLSVLYTILDGCNDNSEAIIDNLIQQYPDKKILKLFAPDVHELKSINIGLRAAEHQGNGFNIILQDDVILTDHEIEEKCILLYNRFDNLGIVSFRHGSDLSRSLLSKKGVINPRIHYIENVMGHDPNPFQLLKTGYFTFREIAIKSPICVPFKVVRDVGCPDELYAPWNDMAYCYKVIQAGFKNGVFSIEFRSDLSWGTTREKVQKVTTGDVEIKNIALFKKQFPSIRALDTSIYSKKKYLIFDSKKKYNKNHKLYFKMILPHLISYVKLQVKKVVLK